MLVSCWEEDTVKVPCKKVSVCAPDALSKEHEVVQVVRLCDSNPGVMPQERPLERCTHGPGHVSEACLTGRLGGFVDCFARMEKKRD